MPEAPPGDSPPKPTSAEAPDPLDPFTRLIGTTLDGRYVLEDIIGMGGMGVVFRAQQTSVHRPVAVKMLHAALAGSPEFYERFRREAELVSHLHHPHIISVHDFGRAPDGACFYVMELLAGESLKEKVKRQGPFSIARAARITGQVARAIGAAHAANIIHRDLKPHNVMCTVVDHQDFAKVLDFGLVKVIEEEQPTGVDAEEGLTVQGQVLGTPQYMSPEQASGETVDRRSDLYSLGAVFYYMLTGSSPYAQKTVRAALKAAATQPLPSATSRRKDAPVPEPIEAFLRRALAFEPDKRPPTAEVFLAELEAALGRVSPSVMERLPTGSTVDPEVGGTSSTAPSKGSSSRAPMLAGVAALLAAVGSLYAWHRVSSGASGGAPDAQVGAVTPPAPRQVDIEMEYSPEKRVWIESETEAFSKSHPGIAVHLVRKASPEAAAAIASGQDKPNLWSPADSIALSLASETFQKRGGAPLLSPEGSDDAPHSLLLTPLVLVAWEDRAAVLRNPPKGRTLWSALHDALASPKGWATIGGKKEWGQVKLALTNPTLSNSGLQAIWLMAHDFYKKNMGVTAAELTKPAFKTWLAQMAAHANAKEALTRNLMEDFNRFGPSRFDAAVVYENIAIDGLSSGGNRWGAIQVCYPPSTAWSDHPVALLAPYTGTAAQVKAAREYIAFLRSAPAQQQALSFGFRPGDARVALKSDDPNSPFNKLAGAGVKLDVPAAVPSAEPEIARALWDAWSGQTH